MQKPVSTRAALHAIETARPAPDFFAGALMGNGGLGAVVTTRPDAVVISFGHNNVWDIRVAEHHADQIGTFAELFQRIESIWRGGGSVQSDPWLREYCKLAGENYSKPYPRPFPCGQVVLGFDRRRAELLGHRLEISTGRLAIFFDVAGMRQTLNIFVEPVRDRLWLRMTDSAGSCIASPFDRIRLIPDTDTPSEFPPRVIVKNLGTRTLAFRQVLPFLETGAAGNKDRAFRLVATVTGALLDREHVGWDGKNISPGELEAGIEAAGTFLGVVQLDEGKASDVTHLDAHPEDLARAWQSASDTCDASWAEFWGKSSVELQDGELEAIWYRNLYFLNCSVRPGVTCPGLFANWSHRSIGTAWHGDYHMNYNTQQAFWVTFSSNHVEKHLPYVDLVDHLLPVSQKWARDYYQLPGAYFPHSAYPTEMNIMPYWVPTWAWEICETPWTVQSLWWHFLYTQDEDFLRNRAFGPITEAVKFLVAYMMRPQASAGATTNDSNRERAGDAPVPPLDGKFHIFPTVPPELYGLQDRWDKNYDCIVDLTLTKFVFNAYLSASDRLAAGDAELAGNIRTILSRFPDYPTADSPAGKVFVSVPGESPDMIMNVPNGNMSVFPGEDVGLHSSPETLQTAINTHRNSQNEGGNDLVFRHLQGARLGVLDLEAFKRQVRYCTLPSGAATDMVLQVHGRYNDELPFDFMARMGIWFENFALPVVINECLLQSYNGTIRLFPNWPNDQDAEFTSLRAVGAFLISAKIVQGTVRWVEIASEKGKPATVINPWTGQAKIIRGKNVTTTRDRILTLPTKVDERIRLEPA